MRTDRNPPARSSGSVTVLRRVAIPSAAFAFALVVWGAIVRIFGAGMTCPDWPRCRGVWLPALDDPVVLEWTHRLAAAVLTLAIAATFVAAFGARARTPGAYRAAWVSLACIVAQIVAGWLTIKYQNDPPSVAAHLVVGIATFCSLLAVVALSYVSGDEDAAKVDRISMSSAGFARLALASTLLTFLAVFAAGYMSASNDGLACTGFPLCTGFGGAITAGQQIHMGHRYAAYVTIVAVTITWVAAVLTQSRRREIVAAAWTAFVLVLLQAGLGVATIASRLAPALRSWHEANAALLAGDLVVLTIFAFRASTADTAARTSRPPAAAS